MSGDNLEKKLSGQMASGMSLSFVGKIMTKFIGLPIQILLARLLGNSGYGTYSLAKTILNWADTFSNAGFPNGTVKFISSNSGNKNSLKGDLIVLIGFPLLLSAIFSFILVVFPEAISKYFNDKNLSSSIQLFGLALPFMTANSILTAAARGFKRIDHKELITITKKLALLGSILFLFIYGYGLKEAILAFLFSNIIGTIIGAAFLFKNLPSGLLYIKSKFEPWKVFRFSAPLFLTGILWTITRRIDVMMIGYFETSSQVGTYAAATTISVLVSFSAMSVNDIIAPVISELFENGNKKQISHIYWRSTKWVSLISIPTAIVLGIFSETVIRIIYGPDFAAGAAVLSVFVLFELGKTIFGPSAFTLQMTGDQNWNLYTNVISSSINALLNIVFIPVLGILGAAIASGVSLLLNNLIHFLLLLRRKDIQLLSEFSEYNISKVISINIPFFTLVMFSYVFFNNLLHYLSAIVVSGCVYAVMAYIYALDNLERGIIRNALA